MFKTAATKLAHSSTIPALAGNSRLQPLQEVIAAEKVVLQSLQKLSTNFEKSSEALKAWASGEGEDLEDAFSACSALLSHWVSSIASFAIHISRVRECMKAVRAREEALDDMHRRKKSLVSKSDSADKKLNKMAIDHKNLRQQTDLSLGLREHINAIDTEILKEEASVGHWKRVKAREWMGVLFGGLLECSEKGAIVATFGRAIAGYVSTEKTQPGLPRAFYSDKPQVASLVVEAERRLGRVSFVGEVGVKAERPPYEYQAGNVPRHPPSYSSPVVQQIPTHPHQPYASHRDSIVSNPASQPYEADDFGAYGAHQRSQTYTPGQHSYPPDQTSPISPARARMSLPLMGGPPGNQYYQYHQYPDSPATPGPSSALSYSPPTPPPQFPNFPQTRSGSGSDLT